MIIQQPEAVEEEGLVGLYNKMKTFLLLVSFILLTLPTYASEKVFGNLEVESSLSVHDTADPIVFIVDSSTHRVGINVDSPSFPLEVSGAVVTNALITVSGVVVTTGTLRSDTGTIDLDNDGITTTNTGTFGNLTIGSGSIVDTSGDITFGDENLTTTGTITSGDITIFDATPILVFKDSNSLGGCFSWFY